MRRKIFIVLVALGFLIMGVRSFVYEVSPQAVPQGQEISLVEYGTLTPLTNPQLATLQNLVDQISDAATKNDWTGASKGVDNLEKSWQKLSASKDASLALEQQIFAGILALHYKVWDQDLEGVLKIARTLTDLIGLLAA